MAEFQLLAPSWAGLQFGDAGTLLAAALEIALATMAAALSVYRRKTRRGLVRIILFCVFLGVMAAINVAINCYPFFVYLGNSHE